MDDLAALRRPLLLAIDAGAEAAEAVRQIATNNLDPTDTATPLKKILSRGTAALGGLGVNAGQVRTACTLLDDFATAVDELNRSLGVVGAEVEPMADASDRLWASTAAAPAILNELNATIAGMEQIRVNLVLNRPVGVEPDPPDASQSGRSDRDGPAA